MSIFVSPPDKMDLNDNCPYFLMPPSASKTKFHALRSREWVFKANQPTWSQGETKIFNGRMEMMYEQDLNGRLRVNRL